MLLNNNVSYLNPLQKYLKYKYLLFLVLLVTLLTSLVLIVLLISMDYMGFSSSITSKNSDIQLTNSTKCKDGYFIDKYNRVDLRMKVAFISMLVQFVLIFACIFIAFQLSTSHQKFYQYFDNLNKLSREGNLKMQLQSIKRKNFIKQIKGETNFIQNNIQDPQIMLRHILHFYRILYILITISILLVCLTFGIYLAFFVEKQKQKNKNCSILLNNGRVITFFSLAAGILLLLLVCLVLVLKKICRIKIQQQCIFPDSEASDKDNLQKQGLLKQINNKKKVDSDDYLIIEEQSDKNTDRALLQKEKQKQIKDNKQKEKDSNRELSMPIISQIQIKNGDHYKELLKQDLFSSKRNINKDQIKEKQIQQGLLPYYSIKKDTKIIYQSQNTNQENKVNMNSNDQSKPAPYRYPPMTRSIKKNQQLNGNGPLVSNGQKKSKYQKVLNSIDFINQKQKSLQYQKQLRQKNQKLKQERPGTIKSIQQRIAEKKAKQAKDGSSSNLPINARSIVYQRSNRSYSNNSNNSSQIRDSRSRQKQDFNKQSLQKS